MSQVASEENHYLVNVSHDQQQQLSNQEVELSQSQQFRDISQRNSNKLYKASIWFLIITIFIYFFAQISYVQLQDTPQPKISNSQGQANQKTEDNLASIDEILVNHTNQQIVIKQTIQKIDIKGGNINLWDLSKDQKTHLLKIYKNYQQNKKDSKDKDYMNILVDANDEAPAYIKQFQSYAQEIRWYELNMSQQQSLSYEAQFKDRLKFRKSDVDSYLNMYRSYQMDHKLISTTRNITKSQFYKGIKYHQLTGQSIEDLQYKKLYDDEKLQLQQKYKLSLYREQLRACVIVPTYNNIHNDRYLWNIQSILQQEYQNLKVIIIDDASSDGTSTKIAKHLHWKNVDRNKYVLIKSKVRNKSLFSFYYAAHKYCDLGEIIYTIDGDDELIGTQAFKVINAIYQTEKPYTLYTIFIINHPNKLTLGNNHQYNSTIKNQNKYRWDRSHGYSHLRTMLSDTFLLVNSSSFKAKNGNFFQLITDNAVYFCAMELSCSKVRFLEEINYWYDYNTENNIFTQMRFQKYQTFVAAVEKKLPYKCLHNYFIQALEWYKTNS